MKRGVGFVVFLAFCGCSGEIGVELSFSRYSQTGAEFFGAIPSLEECSETAIDPGPNLVRRMTRAEYLRSITDLFGVDATTAAQGIPVDQRVEGFTNTSQGLSIERAHVEGFANVAAFVAESAPSDRLVSVAGCASFSTQCNQDLVEELGLLIFRRPLNASELQDYVSIVELVQAEGDSFEFAQRYVMRAMLQAPQFLYRLEDQLGGSGDVRALNSFEIASRLSFLIWGSVPDRTLLDAANEGLESVDRIEAQVYRMLESQRAQETAHRYVVEWLGLDDLLNLNRDATRYPDFTSSLAEAMRQETIELFDRVVWQERRPVVDMFTEQSTRVSPELADFYGFEAENGVADYDLQEVPERGGLMAHASVLALSGSGNDPSIVKRGLFVLGNMLCGTIDQPSMDVDMSMSNLSADASQREYSEDRMQRSCYSCHTQMDPLGYALDSYDGVGKFRTHDDKGNEIRSDGRFVQPGDPIGTPYVEFDEYTQLLNESIRAVDCSIIRPTQFALGRRILQSDACSLAGIKDVLMSEDSSYHALVTAIATHESFKTVRRN